MSIKAKVSELMKASMKSGDKDTLLYVRNLHSAIRKKEIDDRVDLDDAGIQKIIGTIMKQRLDSIEQFRNGGREDLAVKEEAEAAFLKQFLPAQMSEAEVSALVDWAVKESGATTAKEMGKVMGLLMPKVQGKADGKLVNTLVKAKLGG
ncbi:MAG: GatB/YqeY domain-containing protein [Bdellovibrionales bacterium]|nr:GatB/YqeY domain-containing protein [Bdellovibrionales bacterium]